MCIDWQAHEKHAHLQRHHNTSKEQVTQFQQKMPQHKLHCCDAWSHTCSTWHSPQVATEVMWWSWAQPCTTTSKPALVICSCVQCTCHRDIQLIAGIPMYLRMYGALWVRIMLGERATTPNGLEESNWISFEWYFASHHEQAIGCCEAQDEWNHWKGGCMVVQQKGGNKRG